MTWPFDPSAPLVTPEENADYIRRRHGVSEEDWRLPRTLVGTFQRVVWHRLADRCAIPDGRSRGAEVMPVAGAVDGVPVAVVRMMIGAPAAALTLEAAIARGVRDVVVVGSAGTLREEVPIGSVVLVTGAEREDGTSHHYLPAGDVVAADPGLTDLLEAAATERGLRPVRGRAWTIDAPFRETAAAIRRHREAGVLVVEMEAAAMFAVARVRGIRAALIVSVSDELWRPRWRPGFDDPLHTASMLTAAEAALACAAGMP